ncbi:Bug family tripartite tricarboxylate transporter substrate binding protein [Achromobacter marplatensis]|jgi:tripartite-type tricarboxylate transporter receptor subunit TctC|uniref:Bug family tripartite tricarboxylate transporter substrate binding protein n=1 Tax=Achromobacter marplatensis TaxID=470868 RepID=UPI003C72E52A
MTTTLKRIAGAVLCACTLAFAHAAEPPLTIIVPYAPGGMGDTVARLTAQAMTKEGGRTVIVENRPGANGMIGLQAISRASPDGATIGLVPASVLTVNPSIYKDMKVDTAKDISPLTLALSLPNVLVVNPSVPARNLPDFLAYLKANQAKISYGSMGTGSSGHLNGELLQRDTGLELTHVPYKGSAPAMQDLIAGQIQMAFENLPVALPYIQAGKLRAIGVTSTSRSPALPDIPPLADTLPGFEDNIWFAFVGPKGLPAAATEKLHDQLVKAVASPEVSSVVKERGAVVVSSSPAELRDLIVAERDKWASLVKERNVKID